MGKTNAVRRIESDDKIERAPESTTRRKTGAAKDAASNDLQVESVAMAFLSDGCGPNFL